MYTSRSSDSTTRPQRQSTDQPDVQEPAARDVDRHQQTGIKTTGERNTVTEKTAGQRRDVFEGEY